jgi:hypothetical protein
MLKKLTDEGWDLSKTFFGHDLASYHTAKTVRTYLASKGVTVLEHPARGSDGNPVEQMWRPVESVAQQLGYTNEHPLAEAKKLLQQALEAVGMDFVNKLMASYRSRWARIVSCGGEQLDNVSSSAPQVTGM